MSAPLFLRTLRHTRLRQLAGRASAILRRRAFSAAARVAPKSCPALRGSPPSLARDLPSPLFAPRTDAVVCDGEGVWLQLLGTRGRLETPMPWSSETWLRSELLEMNLHYMEWLEALDHEAFERAVVEWIDANPPYTRAAWRASWKSYTVSLRAVVWMQQLAARREWLSGEVIAAMTSSLARQIRFLSHHLERDLGGNHLIKNAKALLLAGRVFRGSEARRWRREAVKMLRAELCEQILPDGMHFERSPAYHAQVFADLLECHDVLERGALRDELRAVLGRMAQVLADLTHPDRRVSLFNDGGLNMTYTPDECLGVYEREVGGRVQPRTVFALEHAGYFGARRAGNLVLADCGSIGPDHLPAHAHGDVLSFEWTVGHKRLIVDAGTLEYAVGPWRDWARGTPAHNTVSVDGQDQAEFWKAFRVGRRPRVELRCFEPREESFVLEGEHDGFARLEGAPRHTRRFSASPDALLIEDFVAGGSGQGVRAHLLLHPDARVDRRGDALVIVSGEQEVELETQHSVSVVDAWWFPDFGDRRRTQQISLHYGSAPCEGVFRLQSLPSARSSTVTELAQSGVLEEVHR